MNDEIKSLAETKNAIPNEMTWQEYIEQTVLPLCRPDARTWQHVAYGLLTELGELMDLEKRRIFYLEDQPRDQYILEVSDIAWYSGVAWWLLSQEAGLSLEEMGLQLSLPLTSAITSKSWDTCFLRLACSATNIMSQSEENYVLVENLMEDLLSMVRLLNDAFPDKVELTLSDVLVVNSNKLAIRYPDRVWRQDRALTRDYAAEDAVVEKVVSEKNS